jgi:hypothetical protein
VTSKYLPSFLPVERYARPRLPSGGSLGPHFPTFIGTTLGYDYHLSISMPYALVRSPIPRLFLSFVSSLACKLVNAQEPLRQRLACLVARYAFSGLLTRKQVVLPSSQATPLSTCPALRPRWCPAHSPLTYPGLLPSATMTTSAFPSKTDSYPVRIYFAGPRLYKFRGSITRPALSLPLASDSRCRADPQGSLLTCWLDFNQAGFSPAG